MIGSTGLSDKYLYQVINLLLMSSRAWKTQVEWDCHMRALNKPNYGLGRSINPVSNQILTIYINLPVTISMQN
ncbi:hypothetical protein PDE_02622 [Penicillium oxalicum 114-2]|uniref:Uncharacterized protein n=1 Tax=Penicillium oxalicum (strain 114-2 / CGMCC 5302) TaxID=933388 RepID=S8AP27_PENO1|nr:hypothetical protein PDE_02622 [Penicillium oxalicum 114-2]